MFHQKISSLLLVISLFLGLSVGTTKTQAQSFVDFLPYAQSNVYLPLFTSGDQSQPLEPVEQIELNLNLVTAAGAAIPEDAPVGIDSAARCLSFGSGQTFQVDLSVKDVRDLASFRVQVGYDANLIEVTAIDVNHFLASNSDANLVSNYDNLPDLDGSFWIEVIDESTSAGQSGSGVLARLTFRAIDSGQSPIILERVTTGDVIPALFDSTSKRLGDSDSDGQFDHPMTSVSVVIGGECNRRPDLLVVGFHEQATDQDRNRIVAESEVRITDSALAEFNSYTVEIISGRTADEARMLLLRDPLVQWVDFVERSLPEQSVKLPNDPEVISPRAHRWDLFNAGQTVAGQQGLIDADIDAHQGWEMRTDCTGAEITTEPIVIAVLDDGLDVTNPDLAANVWRNPLNGTASDVLPAINDVNGAAFSQVGSTAFVSVSGNVIGGAGDDHGTAVASVIGAVGDNNREIAGVCWTAKILALKIDFYNTSIARALRYVLDLKSAGVDIRIVNASLGGPGFSSLVRNVLSRLQDAGILYVTTSGNDGQPLGTPKEGIYRDGDNSNTVSAGDLRLTHIFDSNNSTTPYSAASQVSCGTDIDCAAALIPFTAAEKHFDPDSNTQYDMGEAIYLDNDGDGMVSFGDRRLSLVEIAGQPTFKSQYPPDTMVRCFTGIQSLFSEGDCGRPLVNFLATEKHVGSGTVDAAYQEYSCAYDLENIICVGATDNQDRVASFSNVGSPMVDLFAPGVDIRMLDATGTGSGSERYRDLDGNNKVSQNDVRIQQMRSGSATYAAGSVVGANDNDVGSNLRTYPADVKHDQITTAGPGYDVGEDLYQDNDNNNLVSVGDVRLTRKISGTYNVLAGQPDLNNTLVSFANNEKYNATYFANGTSFASPNVAGIAALCWSMMPDRTAKEIKDLLLRFVDRKPAFAPYSVSGGRLRWACSYELGDAPISFLTVGREGSNPELLMCADGTADGPIHLDPINEHFGIGVSQEHNANTVDPLDQDTQTGNLGPGDPGTCSIEKPDSDAKDDGNFTFSPSPPWKPNDKVTVSFTVCSPYINGAQQFTDVNGGRYSQGKVYATLWFDWNNNGRFTGEYTELLPPNENMETGDEIIELNELTATLNPTLPPTGGCIDVSRNFIALGGAPKWMRWRLDYGEHKGDKNPSPLFESMPDRKVVNEKLIAIYGEVEDHFMMVEPREPTKVVNPTIAVPGKNLHYTITLYGDPSLTTPTTGRAIDQLADLVTFAGNLQASSGNARYDEATRTIIWKGDLTANLEVVIEYDVTVSNNFPDEWPDIENRVEVNNGVITQGAVISTKVQCDPPDPSPPPTKRASVNTIKPGEVFNYTITLPSGFFNQTERVVLTDALPNPLQYAGNLHCSSGDCQVMQVPGLDSIRWTGDVGPDKSVDIQFDALVPAGISVVNCPDEVENRAFLIASSGNLTFAVRTPIQCPTQ